MCIFCDGGTLDGFQLRLHQEIACCGFAVVGVEGRTKRTSWAYTVGLGEHEEHPELILRGQAPADGLAVLRTLGGRVLEGQVLRDGALVQTAAGSYLLRAIPTAGPATPTAGRGAVPSLGRGARETHPAAPEPDRLVAGWFHYYRALGSAPPLRLLDVCPFPGPGEPTSH